MGARRKFDRQFKIDAVRLWESSGKPVAEVARSLGVHPNRLYRWKNELASNEEAAFPGQGKAHNDELARLRKENWDLKMEKEILKKALAIFSKTENKGSNS